MRGRLTARPTTAAGRGSSSTLRRHIPARPKGWLAPEQLSTTPLSVAPFPAARPGAQSPPLIAPAAPPPPLIAAAAAPEAPAVPAARPAAPPAARARARAGPVPAPAAAPVAAPAAPAAPLRRALPTLPLLGLGRYRQRLLVGPPRRALLLSRRAALRGSRACGQQHAQAAGGGPSSAGVWWGSLVHRWAQAVAARGRSSLNTSVPLPAPPAHLSSCLALSSWPAAAASCVAAAPLASPYPSWRERTWQGRAWAWQSSPAAGSVEGGLTRCPSACAGHS